MPYRFCQPLATRTLVAIVVFGTVLMSATVCAPADEPKVSDSLKVMTYNVHHCEGNDGKLDVERIANVINDQQCDLVALQELDRNTSRSDKVDQLARLAELTGMMPSFGKAIDFGGGEYGVGILSRLPIRESRTTKLPSGEKREQRVATEVIVQPKSGPEFIFVSTHLDHTSGENDRSQQTAKLRELFSSGPKLAIVAGDLNAVSSRAEMQTMLEKWTDVDATKQSPTIPAAKPNAKIDYILLPQAGPWEVVSTEVLNEPIASDHLPLVATIRLRK